MVKQGGDDVDWHVFFGAGHVAATDDYKLLVAHSSASYEYENEDDDDGEDCLVVEVKMFSMRSKAWKTIKPPKATFSCEKIPATVVRERLHWLDIDDNADEMVAFDLEKEEFQTVPLPNFSDEMDDHVKVIRLGISAGGCLCVMRFSNLSAKEQAAAADCDSFVDFWVMAE